MSTSFAYIHCDIPEGQTLAEWRAARSPHVSRNRRRSRRLRRLRRLLRSA